MKYFLVIAAVAVLNGYSLKALACEASDIKRTYFDAVVSGTNCSVQGGVREISVQNGEFEVSGRSDKMRMVSMKCNNGDTEIGLFSSDASTCQVKSVSWNPTTRL